MNKHNNCTKEAAKAQFAACKKCGAHVYKMHLAPAFTPICRVCYIKENPRIDEF